jgi:hypothetical protein
MKMAKNQKKLINRLLLAVFCLFFWQITALTAYAGHCYFQCVGYVEINGTKCGGTMEDHDGLGCPTTHTDACASWEKCDEAAGKCYCDSACLYLPVNYPKSPPGYYDNPEYDNDPLHDKGNKNDTLPIKLD